MDPFREDAVDAIRSASAGAQGPVRHTLAGPPMVEAIGLSRDYGTGDAIVRAVRSIDLAVGRGELLAVRGRSGSGKTTLLNLLGGLDRPTAGRVLIDGREISAMDEDELVGVRRQTVAFVFQAFGLVPFLTAAENVEVPLRLVHADATARDTRVADLLDLVGLGERARHRPHELSGGEQQRVAIARALANKPSLLLADEPTGQLDSDTGHSIMTLLRTIIRAEGITAIVATHDLMMLDVADRVVELSDGQFIAPTAEGSAAGAGRA
jgi:putative ABC transport system ATP-binding protein